MKEILKNLGLIIILIGVIFLAVVVFTKVQTNTHLVISIFMIVGGLLSHILINKYIE